MRIKRTGIFRQETVSRIPGLVSILSRLAVFYRRTPTPKTSVDQTQPLPVCDLTNRRADSAVHRAPIEIWWKILHEVIDTALEYRSRVFDTTFEGDDWMYYSSWSMLDWEDRWLRNAREQTKIIGSVCRSWQVFSQLINDRYVILKFDFREKLLRGITKASKAHRVAIWDLASCKQYNIPLVFDHDVGWEIIEVYQREVTELVHIPLPHLRRLRMYSFQNYLNLNLFLDAICRFTSLTWLDYEVDTSRRRQPIPIHQDKPPVLLPNLQVLWYKIRHILEFPFSYLILPSLRYLTLHIYELPSRVPLFEILSFYRQTLQSFVTGQFKDRGDKAVIHFSPWSEFPKLEELVLNEPWTAYFEPLPRSHPLRRLHAQLGSLGIISSLLEGESMKEMVLGGFQSTKESGWQGQGDSFTIGEVELEQMFEKAQTCGIEFTAFVEEDEVEY